MNKVGDVLNLLIELMKFSLLDNNDVWLFDDLRSLEDFRDGILDFFFGNKVGL